MLLPVLLCFGPGIVPLQAASAPFAVIAAITPESLAAAPRLPVAQKPGDDKVVKALEAWLKAYRGGKIDITSKDDIAKGSIAEKNGLLRGVVGTVTPKRELALMLEQAAALDNAAAAEVVLTVAAIGLDHGSVKYTTEMRPFEVRRLGEQWLAKFVSQPALDLIMRVARGEERVDKAYGVGIRAAAIRTLGTRHDDAARGLCEQQLTANELPLRLAAAEALGALGDERSGEALTHALESERNEVLIGAIIDALRVCYGPYLLRPAATASADDKKKDDKEADGKKDADGKDGKPGAEAPAGGAEKPADADPAKPKGDGGAAADAKAGAAADQGTGAPPALKEPTPAALAAARAAIAALGRTTWRADMQILVFLGEFRTMEAVPALITILQRFKEHPEQVQSGVLSGLLLHRAHELLVSQTGAVFAIDAPDKWSEFWAQEQAKLLGRARTELPAPKRDRTVTGFCGIPVEGNRVVFIIDLSGSMEFTMRPRPGDADALESVGGTRLDFARTQLKRAISDLPDNSRFNFITFNGRPKAVVWGKDLLEATKKNKAAAIDYLDDKKRFSATYGPRDPAGGTNLWSGLEEALRMKTLVYGDRNEQSIDEIFVVSDGAPSAGEVTDPIEILQLVNETNRFTKIRINTIFITSPNDRDPRNLSLDPSEFMRRLAEQNGGRFVEFKS